MELTHTNIQWLCCDIYYYSFACRSNKLCVSNKSGKEEDDIQADKHVTGIDFVLIRKEHQLYWWNVKVILGKFQHASFVADIHEM